MGETASQIERHIRHTRDDLAGNISELEDKIKTAVDWRAQFEEHPGTMMALAFGGGLLLSALMPPAGSSHRRLSEYVGSLRADHDLIDPHFAYDREEGQRWDAVDALKSALIGVAAAKITGFIEDLVPGFRQEFTMARTRNKSEP